MSLGTRLSSLPGRPRHALRSRTEPPKHLFIFKKNHVPHSSDCRLGPYNSLRPYDSPFYYLQADSEWLKDRIHNSALCRPANVKAFEAKWSTRTNAHQPSFQADASRQPVSIDSHKYYPIVAWKGSGLHADCQDSTPSVEDRPDEIGNTRVYLAQETPEDPAPADDQELPTNSFPFYGMAYEYGQDSLGQQLAEWQFTDVSSGPWDTPATGFGTGDYSGLSMLPKHLIQGGGYGQFPQYDVWTAIPNPSGKASPMVEQVREKEF
ncbi:hypothetical protein C8Q73DRAFT_796383 [Cubamyces lactineus]|nr:hypothetical protein C8Q73DRAFT_796383 [Cubamyces lactineus]